MTRALEFAMATVRETVRLGLAARGQAKLKVRQPLRAAVVVAAGAERDAIERLQDLALDELNVKEIRYVSQADELGSYEVKPNYRALGPRFGKNMPHAAAAVAALEPAHVADALRSGHTVAISVDGHDHELGADDLMLAMSPLEGYQLEREGSHAVALELELDDELRREGLAREIVHAIQNARKGAGLQVEDRISLTLGGDEELVAAGRAHEDYLKRETLALSVEYNGASAVDAVKIEGQSAPYRGTQGVMRLALVLLATLLIAAPAQAAPPQGHVAEDGERAAGCEAHRQGGVQQRRVQLAFVRVSPRATLARKTLRTGRFTVDRACRRGRDL